MALTAPALVIAMVLYHNMTMLDVVGPYEMLHRLPNVVVKFVGESAGAVIRDSQGSIGVVADYSFEQVPSPDVILVPGGFNDTYGKDTRFLRWLRKGHETSLYTTTVCTGAVVIGYSGITKGKTMATHWAVYDQLAQFGAHYTRARYFKDGKLISSAGVSAGIDAGIYLASLLSDEVTARWAQLIAQYDPQPPYKSGQPSDADPQVWDLVQKYGSSGGHTFTPGPRGCFEKTVCAGPECSV